MKKTIYLTAIILLVTVFTSCKKETPKPSIIGYWSGSGIATGMPTPQFIGFLYNSNGTIRAYGSNPDTTLSTKYDGTYTEDADSVRLTVASGSMTTQFSGKLNTSATQLTGTFRRTTGTYTGTYTVTR